MKRIAWLCWCQTFQVFPTRASKLDIYFFKKWVTLHHDRMDQKLSMPHTWVTKIAAQGHLVKKKKKSSFLRFSKSTFFSFKIWFIVLCSTYHAIYFSVPFSQSKTKPKFYKGFWRRAEGGEEDRKRLIQWFLIWTTHCYWLLSIWIQQWAAVLNLKINWVRWPQWNNLNEVTRLQ